MSSSQVDDTNASDGSIRKKIRKFNNIGKRFSANKIGQFFKKKRSLKAITPKIPFENLHSKIGQHFENHQKPTEQTSTPVEAVEPYDSV